MNVSKYDWIPPYPNRCMEMDIFESKWGVSELKTQYF